MPTGYTIPFGWAIMLVNSALQFKPKHIQGSTCFQSLALEGMWLQTLLEGTNDPTNVIAVYSGKSP